MKRNKSSLNSWTRVVEKSFLPFCLVFGLITFTLPNGTKVWVNPQQIDGFHQVPKGYADKRANTEIDMQERIFFVRETPDEVAVIVEKALQDK